MSANQTAPKNRAQFAEAANVIGVVIPLSPFFNLMIKLKDANHL